MTAVPSAIGLVASDLPRTLSFYRAIGLDIPADADSEPHVEVALAGGFRILFDPESTIKSFDPEWTPAPAGSPRTALAFECADPAEVDATYAAMTAAGFDGHLEPWTRSGGSATRRCATRTATASTCSPRCRRAEMPTAR